MASALAVPLRESGQAKDFAIVTVKVKDGKKYSVKWETWRGHHTSPLNTKELITKYKDATSDVLSPRQTNRTIELVLDLENLKDMSELMKTVTLTG